MQDLRSRNVRVSYVMRGSVATGSSPEGICVQAVAAIGKMLSENFSEPGGGSTFKTSATGAEEVNGAYESAGSGEHLKKWY